MSAFPALGDAVNILRGLRTEWPGARDSSGQGTAGPFFTPPQRPFLPFETPDFDAGSGAWEGPTASLHDSLDALLDAIFAYRFEGIITDQGGFRLPPHAPMLGGELRQANIDALERRFGLDLRAPDIGGFLLLKSRRCAHSAVHEAAQGGVGHRIRIESYWTPDGRRAMRRLPITQRIFDGPRRHAVISTRQAERYLAWLYEFGTHLVVRLQFGELILQVFACRGDRYRLLEQRLQRELGGTELSGTQVLALAGFLNPTWMAQRGRIISASGDPELARSVAEGAWQDPDGKDSLLTPFAAPQQEQAPLFARFRSAVPIAIDLAPQSPYMELFRANAWQQVFRGALLQRFGTGVQMPLAVPAPAARRDFYGSDPLLRVTGGDRSLLLRQGLEMDDLACAAESPNHALTALGLRLTATDVERELQIPAARVRLFATQTIAGTPGGAIPTLRLTAEAFQNWEFYTREMHGALFVENADGSARETLFQGFAFHTPAVAGHVDPLADGLGAVALKGDVRNPPQALLQEIPELLEESVAMALVQLLRGSRSAEAERIARSHLEWLASLLRKQEPLSTFRLGILFFARMPVQSIEPSGREGHRREEGATTEAWNRLAGRWRQLAVPLRQLTSVHSLAGDHAAARLHHDLMSLLNEVNALMAAEATTSSAMSADPSLKSKRAAFLSCRQAAIEATAALQSELAEATVDATTASALLGALASALRGDGRSPHKARFSSDDESLADWAKLISKLQPTLTAIGMMEAIIDGSIAPSPDSLLETTEGPFDILHEDEWRSLPGMTTAALGATANLDSEWFKPLRTALITLSEVAPPYWVACRSVAQRRLAEEFAGSCRSAGGPHDRHLAGLYWSSGCLLAQWTRVHGGYL